MPTDKAPPVVVSIAGSDSSAGAGIQADLLTFADHGVYGATVVTAVTAQSTTGVHAVHTVPTNIVLAQLDAVLTDMSVAAIKVGMLADAEQAAAVAERLEKEKVPVVLDPVLVASTGSALYFGSLESHRTVLCEQLFPLCALVTPNLAEARALLGDESADAERAARLLLARTLAPAVLVTGGAEGTPGGTVTDLLLSGGGVQRIEHPFIDAPHTHGSGCTLSSAVAACLAKGASVNGAVDTAVAYTAAAVRGGLAVGKGSGPVGHGHQRSA